MIIDIVKKIFLGLLRLIGFAIAACFELAANIISKVAEEIKKHTR